MKQQWENYLNILEEHKDFKYTKLVKKRISDIKEKLVGGVFYNGKIYGIVNSERKGMCISPEEKEVHMFGKVKVGTFKWTGGCAYQGKIYGFPRKENSLLVIDPEKETLDICKLSTNYRGEHHYGGICTPVGMIYQPPRNTNHILCIDLNSRETKTIPIGTDGKKCRYVSTVLHPNGKVYMLPEEGGRIVALDPETDEWDFWGGELDCRVFGAVVGRDGNIYGYCKQGDGLLKVNVEDGIIERICTEIGNVDSYGSVIVINGKIYSIPATANRIFEFDIDTQQAKMLFQIEEEGVAKCAGGGVGCDGTICMIPDFGEYGYFMASEENVNIEEAKMNNVFVNTSY